jgi:hypothetical protein
MEEAKCVNKPFGGKAVVLNHRQILPVVRKGRREDIVYFTINIPYI